jgi:hypothetical protein
VQFLLLFCAAEFLDRYWGKEAIPKTTRRMVAVATLFLMIGIGTNLLEVITLRGAIGSSASRTIMTGEMFRNDTSAERLSQLRAAYSWIRSNTPPDAVIQENPLTWQMVAQGQYSERRTVVYGSNPSYMVGDDHAEYLSALDEIRANFAGSTTLQAATSTCKRFGLNYVVLQRGDDQWSSPTSYIPQLQPVFSTESVLVFRCSPASAIGTTK